MFCNDFLCCPVVHHSHTRPKPKSMTKTKKQQQTGPQRCVVFSLAEKNTHAFRCAMCNMAAALDAVYSYMCAALHFYSRVPRDTPMRMHEWGAKLLFIHKCIYTNACAHAATHTLTHTHTHTRMMRAFAKTDSAQLAIDFP